MKLFETGEKIYNRLTREVFEVIRMVDADTVAVRGDPDVMANEALDALDIPRHLDTRELVRKDAVVTRITLVARGLAEDLRAAHEDGTVWTTERIRAYEWTSLSAAQEAARRIEGRTGIQVTVDSARQAWGEDRPQIQPRPRYGVWVNGRHGGSLLRRKVSENGGLTQVQRFEDPDAARGAMADAGFIPSTAVHLDTDGVKIPRGATTAYVVDLGV